MQTIPTTKLPKEYWLHRNKRYLLRGVILSQLPYAALEYENILKANHIPYRKITRFVNPYNNDTEDVLEYWNPEVGFEEGNLTLPLYAEMPNFSYRYCQKNYTQKVPTEECIKAAKKTELFIKNEIREYEQILRKVRHYEFAKEQLADNVVTVCSSNVTPYTSSYDIEMNNDHFILLRVPDSIIRVPKTIIDSEWVVICNMNKIAQNGYLTIRIPKDLAGFAIGRNGSNVRYWKEILGVKKINVVPV